MKDIVKFIIVLLIIVVIISILYSYSKEEGSTVMSNDVTQNENIEINKENENTTNKTEKEEQKDNIENKEQANNKEENKEDNIGEKEESTNKNDTNTQENETEKEETTTSSNKGQAGNNVELTDREKAIKLVKDEYGVSDNSISYKIVNVDGANYTISVSSTETTQVIAWYTANIETGKVTME